MRFPSLKKTAPTLACPGAAVQVEERVGKRRQDSALRVGPLNPAKLTRVDPLSHLGKNGDNSSKAAPPTRFEKGVSPAPPDSRECFDPESRFLDRIVTFAPGQD